MHSAADAVLYHHRAAAAMWGAGGLAYDDISFAISDALAHAAQRLNAQPGEAILDVATGTGWSARNVARTGARVTAVDIAPELLAAAESLSAHVSPKLEFRLADAERLPFEDGRFDGVISTFGVIFAHDQARAARELGRVCRSGGRLALTAWAPDGAVAEFFALIARHAGAPAPQESPLAWGDSVRAEALLGGDFELIFEPGVSEAYHADAADIWRWYMRGFGPLRQTAAALDAERLAAFRREVDDYHNRYRAAAGLHVKRGYLAILGIRR
jgi:SAM-dependent methyltransferase